MTRMFTDPTPYIEKAVPRTKGKALTGGYHRQTINVSWQGKPVSAIVKGLEISAGMQVWVVRIQNRNFAILAAGGYKSTEPRSLADWNPKAPACEAIRQLMKDNPKRYQYQIEKVVSYDSANKTALMASGHVLPVRFGTGPNAAVAKVFDSEMGLIWNGKSDRHVIGGEFMDLDITFTGIGFAINREPLWVSNSSGISYGGIPGYLTGQGFYFYTTIPIQISFIEAVYDMANFGFYDNAVDFNDFGGLHFRRWPGEPNPSIPTDSIFGPWEPYWTNGPPLPPGWSDYYGFIIPPGYYAGGTFKIGTKNDESSNLFTLGTPGLWSLTIPPWRMKKMLIQGKAL